MTFLLAGGLGDAPGGSRKPQEQRSSRERTIRISGELERRNPPKVGDTGEQERRIPPRVGDPATVAPSMSRRFSRRWSRDFNDFSPMPGGGMASAVHLDNNFGRASIVLSAQSGAYGARFASAVFGINDSGPRTLR